jgi:branched-chain amino acid transport system substrate-binding protein
MRRLFLLFFTLGALALSAAEPLKIGVVAPLTGNLSVSGQALKNSLLLAQEDTPEFKTKLFFEDTESTLSGVNLAMRRLASLNHVDVIFSPYSQEAALVAPFCDQKGILHLSCCWNSIVVEKSKYTFSNSVSFRNYDDATIRLLKQKGYKRVAIIGTLSPGVPEGNDYLAEQCKKQGIDIVANETYTPELRDFRTPILRLKEKSPDVYYLLLLDPACDIFTKQLHELLPGSNVTGYLDECQDKEYIEGTTYISEYPPIPDFYARYLKKFHVSAEQTLAPNVYDSYRMLAKVSSELPKWNVQAAADKMRSMKEFPGITGSLTCAPTGVFLSQTHVVKIVKGQKEFEK